MYGEIRQMVNGSNCINYMYTGHGYCNIVSSCVYFQEYGLVVVGEEEENGEEVESEKEDDMDDLSPRKIAVKKVLLSQEASELLSKGSAQGSLGESPTSQHTAQCSYETTSVHCDYNIMIVLVVEGPSCP